MGSRRCWGDAPKCRAGTAGGALRDDGREGGMRPRFSFSPCDFAPSSPTRREEGSRDQSSPLTDADPLHDAVVMAPVLDVFDLAALIVVPVIVARPVAVVVDVVPAVRSIVA